MWNSNDKGSSSSNTAPKAETINSANEFKSQQQQKQSSSSSQFRISAERPLGEASSSLEQQWSTFGTSDNTNYYKSSPYPALSEAKLPPDGADVLSLLNSNAYTDSVYSFEESDLSSGRSDSFNITSPTTTSSTYLVNLLTAQDVSAYLEQNTYTEDVYGLPMFVQRLLSEAKEEVILTKSEEKAEHRALDRLKMLKDHLLMKTAGDVEVIQDQGLGRLISEEEMEKVWSLEGL